MALKCAVERLSHRQHQDADIVNATVLNAWEIFPTKTIGKFFERWVKVLDFLLKDNGGNRFVEKDRGKLTNDPTSSNPKCFLNFSL